MLSVLEESKRCLKCKKPLCKTGCPIDTEIPELMQSIVDGNLEEAGKRLFINNPLSIVCSLVCYHEKQCEGHCVLKKDPIKIGMVEHYASEYYLDQVKYYPSNGGGRVGIIGSGPAGITIAFILAAKGHKVTLFESHDAIGGVMRYGIPEFRLPKQILDRIKSKLIEFGVKIRPNTLVGPVLTVNDLFRDGYDAIFIGTGVWNPRKMDIKGESLGHVHYAIDYLKNPNAYDFGEHVTVIGAGNVAMDVARTLRRNQVKDVTILYRKDEEHMPASQHEITFAKLEGVDFEFYKTPVEINDDGIVYKETYIEEDAWLSHSEEKLYKCDNVIIAVSQAPKSNIVSRAKDIEVDDYGLVKTDLTGHTTKEGVFASGDVVTGARTVVEAVKYSKGVAETIDQYVKEKLNK